MRNIPVVTKYLLIVNVLAYLVCKLTGEDASGNFLLNDTLGLHFFMASDFHIYQLFTYMFMHASFEHILFNMFALWMFGCVVERVWGPNKFIFYYIACGVGAGLFQEVAQLANYMVSDLAAYDFVQTPLGRLTVDEYLNQWTTVGASGAIYAILLAFGMIFPEERIFIFPLPIPIKAKWFVIGYAAIELVSALSTSNDGVAHLAHLGGMVFGFFMIRYWRRQAGGYHGSSTADAINKLWGIFGGKRRGRSGGFTYTQNEAYTNNERRQEWEYNAKKQATQEEIDRILDKIRKSGYDSLTREEKQTLFDQSNK